MHHVSRDDSGIKAYVLKMSAAYSYVTLRYVHDIVTGEFVNVGVVVYAPSQNFLRARFLTDFRRLNAMFREIDDAHLREMLQYLVVTFDCLEQGASSDASAIVSLVQQVLPADDSSLQWSEAGGGITSESRKSGSGESRGQI